MTDQGEGIVKKKIRLERTYPEVLQSHFVSNIVVQHRPEYFILSFFEVWPPPILGDNEEKQEILESLEMIEAKCVARLVVPPSAMREFVEVMTENLENYEQMMTVLDTLEEESEDG